MEVAWWWLHLNSGRFVSKHELEMLSGQSEVHETKQPSVPPSRLTERQTDTHSYCKYKFILLYSFWVLSTAVMCIPMPYLLPTFVYKKNIYYHNNEDDNETNDDDDDYCISIVYVADSYWLFTTVEQKSYSETSSLCRVSIHIVYCKTRRKKKPPQHLQRRMPLADYQEVFNMTGMICKVMRVMGRSWKKETKNLENVIHCCKCNGQNVSCVSIVKPCVLFSVFL